MVILLPEHHPNLLSSKPHPHRTAHIIVGVSVAFVAIVILALGYVYMQYMSMESPPPMSEAKEDQVRLAQEENPNRTLTPVEINLKTTETKSANPPAKLTAEQIAKKKAQLSQQ